MSSASDIKCKCGKDISHKRVKLCSTCYRVKRKELHRINEQLRNQRDPSRRDSIARAKSSRYSELKSKRTLKKCGCGNDALKGSRYSLCRPCSTNNRKSKKIKYQMERRRNHLPSKIRENIKSRIKRALKGEKSLSVVSYLGCSMTFYLKYLESKFSPGMNWSNYGKMWHIDHVVPLSVDFNDLNLYRYDNTQPIWIVDHFNKTALENKEFTSEKFR